MSETNFDAPGVAKLTAQRIKDDIDAFAVEKYDDGHRNHLGCSLIGEECKRKLWFGFRWIHREQFAGRMLRLFQRGHREEDRYSEYLRGIGVELYTHDEKTGKQFRVVWAGGHAGGSLDGVAILPAKYNYSKPLLTEFKTNSTGRAFTDLIAEGMARAKFMHFAQTCSYATAYGFDWTLYLNTNKNDDDMHVEIAKVDTKLGEQMRQKAEMIVISQKMPPRLSENKTHKNCQYCAFKGVCFDNEPAERNCRSCKYAEARDNATWFCTGYGQTIPIDIIKTGCENWFDIRNA